jgi:ankyrin repeat protein
LDVVGRRYNASKTLEFFRLLSSERYQDFGSVFVKKSYSATYVAVRSQGQALESLKVLFDAGVPLNRVAGDGRVPLHYAAETARDPGVLEYLCSVGGLADIDKQDQWGWTPLHYAVLSEQYGYCLNKFQKVDFLLSQGADTEIRAGNLQWLGTKFPTKFTPLELAAGIRPSIFSDYIEALKRAGRPTRLELDEEIFVDVLLPKIRFFFDTEMSGYVARCIIMY